MNDIIAKQQADDADDADDDDTDDDADSGDSKDKSQSGDRDKKSNRKTADDPKKGVGDDDDLNKSVSDEIPRPPSPEVGAISRMFPGMG